MHARGQRRRWHTRDERESLHISRRCWATKKSPSVNKLGGNRGTLFSSNLHKISHLSNSVNNNSLSPKKVSIPQIYGIVLLDEIPALKTQKLPLLSSSLAHSVAILGCVQSDAGPPPQSLAISACLFTVFGPLSQVWPNLGSSPTNHATHHDFTLCQQATAKENHPAEDNLPRCSDSGGHSN